MADYDVVVIGAGNGGLTAALSLAKKGVKVLLLERHNVPGGCATSFIRGRFEFEVALHQLSGLGRPEAPGPLRNLLAGLGVLDQLEFVEMSDLYRLVLPGELDITLKADRAEALAALKEQFPRESQAIDRFFNFLYSFAMELVGVVFMRDPEASPDKYPLYFRYALKDSQSVLDEYFQDPRLKLAVGAYWPYVGLSFRQMVFSDLALVLFSFLEFKPWHLKGGSQMMSNAILDAFLEAGGQAKFNCGAKKILISNGRVRGLITESGDEISTDYIISNAGTITTYVELIGPELVPPEVFTILGQSTVGPSAFTIYMGLDCEPAEIGVTEETNFLCTGTDTDRAYARFKTLEKPEMTLFTCYDVADPDFSPPGTCQVSLLTLHYADPWLGVSPTAYAETKYRFAEKLLEIADQAFPGFRDHIEEMEVASPLTHLRYLGHPGGAIYGFDKFAKDSNMFVPPTSPIEGLYFAGTWAGMAGFQPTLQSGQTAAGAVLRALSRK